MARDRDSRKDGLFPTAITLSHAPVRIPPGKISETKPTYRDTVLSFGFLQPVPVCLCSEYSCEGVFLVYPSKQWTCDREMAGTVPGRFPRECRRTLAEMDPESSPELPTVPSPHRACLHVPPCALCTALTSSSSQHCSASQHGRTSCSCTLDLVPYTAQNQWPDLFLVLRIRKVFSPLQVSGDLNICD